MMIARWQIDARFGHKQEVIARLRNWARDIPPQAGLNEEKGRLLSGSVGALEATVEHNWEVADLAARPRLGEARDARRPRAVGQRSRALCRVGNVAMDDLPRVVIAPRKRGN